MENYDQAVEKILERAWSTVEAMCLFLDEMPDGLPFSNDQEPVSVLKQQANLLSGTIADVSWVSSDHTVLEQMPDLPLLLEFMAEVYSSFVTAGIPGSAFQPYVNQLDRLGAAFLSISWYDEEAGAMEWEKLKKASRRLLGDAPLAK